MTDDTYLRADDTGRPLLDNDGNPLRELVPDSADALLDHGAALAELAFGERSWRFGHVIVDEAQDLTPMQWRMIARRARGRSMTIVGDLAQRSVPLTDNDGAAGWLDRLPPELHDHDYRELTINYRSPHEVSVLATAVLAEHAPGVTAGRAIRSSGHPPQVIDAARGAADGSLADAVADAVGGLRRELDGGRVAVIGATEAERLDAAVSGDDRIDVTWLDPWSSKGLEFDAVVLVEPARIMAEPSGMSLLYVALTRTTDRLILVHHDPLPTVLANALG